MLGKYDIAERLKRRNMRQVSKDTGIGYATIWRLANSPDRNPGLRTIEIVSEYLETHP